jgi:hypothetical protein
MPAANRTLIRQRALALNDPLCPHSQTLLASLPPPAAQDGQFVGHSVPAAAGVQHRPLDRRHLCRLRSLRADLRLLLAGWHGEFPTPFLLPLLIINRVYEPFNLIAV